MLVFLLVATALSKCSHSDFAMCSSNKAKVTWDYVLHVQTWPGNFCKSKCCDLPKTTMMMRDGFTMHGWWPEFVSNGYPSCCTSPYTDAEVQKTIDNDAEFMEALSLNWASLSKCKFFNYEYDKHGTCLTNIYDGATGVKDYAMAAMNFLNTYDIWKIFKANGVLPDGSTGYSKEWLRGLITAEVGVDNPLYFVCSGGHLSELRACTNVNKADKMHPFFIECPSTAMKQETCGTNIIFDMPPNLKEGGCVY
ncbi:ribonuclease DdI precursor, putative [Entamoeba invadens IP1]|uniref:Ribonuclease DdI, putative n=1 Tax=Entamoeba invadens IP1 TaxID=370355 RepID=A0A0A1TWR0_ENTIV|nr:ribonuclease DdI precursor, putative [Entamoeba invadens IP1]ELP85637.1 ribonuclease DdI precursor, putative [Entamoeba invadens IP1]|eukprot:XP_004184983.1 ribonuclease DdI precursor, putative [Entamoeba invadens IP1]